MKKSCLLLLVPMFLCSALSLQAQVWMGLKGGYNSSQVVLDPNLNTATTLTGYLGGVILKVSANPNVGLQTELNYSQKGWTELTRSTNGEINPNLSFTMRYNYIDFPILTNIFVGKKRVKYFLNFGPHLSYLLSASNTTNDTRADQSTVLEPTYPYDEGTAKPVEFGVTVGLGLTIDMLKGTFQFEGRGTMGLNNIIDRESEGAPLGSQNQVINFSVAYLFPLGNLKKEKAEVPE
ncbi:porin family protein [Flexithrix dorotheae]|uniref:porin family protein n=1 Tax=Flexithrix dorotheae TaxID=70993 RepID=UPI0003726AFC|nr:porin family protein [Flexithrix dorotheae]